MVALLQSFFPANRGRKKLGAGSISRRPVMQCRPVLFVRGVFGFSARERRRYGMEAMTFKEYVKVREGVLLPDRPARVGIPRLNPTPFTQKRLKRIIGPRPQSVARLADGVLPASPGAYVLYDPNGLPYYIGKAGSLEKVVGLRLSQREPNPLVRGQVAAARLFPTKSVGAAEDREGELFDVYLRIHGKYPPGNRSRPPRSSMPDDELAGIRVRAVKAAPPADDRRPCFCR